MGYDCAPNAELCAVCDIDPQRAALRASGWDAAKSYTDYHDLLADPEVDAVEIITPHHLHAQMGVDALAADKHVSMQKPMATTIAECDQLIAAADASERMFRTFEISSTTHPWCAPNSCWSPLPLANRFRSA